MEMLKFWLHHYPMLVGIALFLLILAVLGVFFAVLMHQAGMSLKPLAWFFVFVALVGGPQAIVHVLDVVAFKRQNTQPDAAESPSVARLPPVAWNKVFGPDADPDLMTDPRTPLQAVLGAAQDARLSFNAQGESALAARFETPAAAQQAHAAYAGFFQLGTSHAGQGLTAQRYAGAGSGEWNHVVAVANELYAWTGPTRASVEARATQALGTLALSAAPARTPQRAHEARLVSGNLGWKIMLPFMTLNLLVVVLWFFWGASWATRIAPNSTSAVLDVGTLRQRIVAAYGQDTPIQVAQQPDGSIVVDWRYGDARWLDFMRAHKLVRTHRLVLHPDASDHTVRVREYWSALDISAGAGEVRLNWQQASGLQFFQLEKQRVFGVQLNDQGLPTGALSHTISFDLQSMKRPAIEAVTHSGWAWQPTLLHGPVWLRWLTG